MFFYAPQCISLNNALLLCAVLTRLVSSTQGASTNTNIYGSSTSTSMSIESRKHVHLVYCRTSLITHQFVTVYNHIKIRNQSTTYERTFMWSALSSVITEMPNYKQSISKQVKKVSKNMHIICFLDPTKKFCWQQAVGHKYKYLR